MAKLQLAFASGLVGLTAVHCDPHLGMLEVPAQVEAGQEFSITVHANDPMGFHGGGIACVVQLPLGVAITGVDNTAVLALTRDRPALIGLYTAEPGHYLASFDAYVTAVNGALTLILRAPTSAPGPLTVKVSLAADWTGYSAQGWEARVPLGILDFASIGGASSRSFTVVSRPPAFVRSTAGLPVELDRVAFGDVDGDGNDDLVAMSVYPSVTLRTCLSRPGSAWQTVVTNVTPPVSTAVVALGDFDGDGHLDAALAGQVWFGDGSGTFVSGPTFTFVSPVMEVSVGDLDRDGLADVAFAGQSFVRVFRSNGDRTFADWSTGLPNNQPTAPYFGLPLLRDLTQDGFADLAIPYGTGARIDVYAGNGLGSWTAPAVLAPAGSPLQMDIGDITGDGRPDLVVALYTGTQLFQAFEHQGNNQWATAPLAPVPGEAGWGLALLDYDRDGRLDVAASDSPGYRTNTMWNRLRLFRNAGPGTFLEVADSGLTAFGWFGTRLATGDLDGDTFPDLAADSRSGLVWRNMMTGLSPFGAGCAAAGVAPSIGTNGPPVLGTGSFAVELRNGVANGGGLLWVGFSKRYAFGLPLLPFDLTALGAPGCSVLAEQFATGFVVLDPQGVARMALPLPNDPALRYLTVFGQGAVFAAGANQLGALFSGGLAIRLQ